MTDAELICNAMSMEQGPTSEAYTQYCPLCLLSMHDCDWIEVDLRPRSDEPARICEDCAAAVRGQV